jgi:hypothetical protein
MDGAVRLMKGRFTKQILYMFLFLFGRRWECQILDDR